MKAVKTKATQSISVKAYAELIGKSDKTVYKMIKDGLIAASKGKSGYKVMVDTYVLEQNVDMKKELNSLMKEFKELRKRIEKLESKSLKKTTPVKKVSKPIKKSVKKTTPKLKTNSVKKPLKKAVKKSIKIKSIKK